MNKTLVLIFIIAFLVRLIALNQSLWLDEGTTAKVIHSFSYRQIISQFAPTDFHPPFYYLFMRFWSSIFGLSEISLRLPSVFFSILTGLLVYLAGKKIKNETIGKWAAIFFLFNPLVIYYSQEARMYLMATFFLTGAFYFYLQIIDKIRPKIQHVVLCNVFIFLSFMTFYGSAFFISAMYVYLFINKKWRSFNLIHPGFLLAFFMLLPLLYHQLTSSRETMKIVVNWSQVLGKATLKNLFLIPLKFSIGRISFDPKIFYYGISVPWTIFVWFLAVKSFRKQSLFLFILFFPLVLGLLFSLFSPLLQYFRFIFLIPVLCLLLAVSIKKPITRGIVAVGFLVFALGYLLLPQFHREDWRSLSHSISVKKVYAIPSSMDALMYYRKDLEIISLDKVSSIQDSHILVVPYTSEIYGSDYRSILKKRRYTLDIITSFRGLTTENYSLK